MGNNKKVIFILHLPPPVHGSSIVGQQIYESKKIRETFDCDFINLSTSRNLAEIGKNSIIKYIRTMAIYFKAFFHMLFRRYDICYIAATVSGIGVLKDLPLVLLADLFCKKVVIHQHNKGVGRYSSKAIYDIIYKCVYRRSKVVLLSWFLYPDISKYVKKENVYICPNGVPHNDRCNTTSKMKNHFLFLSNLIETKGCIVLLDACELLYKKGYEFICDFVGAETTEITQDSFLKEIEKRNLTNVVVYHGKKIGKDKNVFFENASVFVFPTYYAMECFPVVLLEAMQCGLPCISTNEGGIADILIDGENGFIVPKMDKNALADRMELLLNEPDLCEKMGKSAYKIYNEKYREEMFEETMFDILKNI